MPLQLPTLGFLVSSGVHKDYKELFLVNHRRKGFFKACNTFLIRLSLLLSLPEEEQHIPTLDKLYINMCYEDDLLFMCKPIAESTPVQELVKLIKESLNAESPFTFIKSKVSTHDNKYLVFDV